MRLTRLTSLVLLALLVSGSWAHAGRVRAQVKQGPPNARAKVQQVKESWIVRGVGEKESDARLDALNKAKEKTLTYLAERGVALKWDLPLVYIDKNMVTQTQSAEDKDLDVPGIDPVKQIDLYVELSSRDYQYFLKREAELKGHERMQMLGKFLAGMIAVLAAVGGYFRLEEATKGYYTAWLRIGALTFLGAIGAGLWLLS